MIIFQIKLNKNSMLSSKETSKIKKEIAYFKMEDLIMRSLNYQVTQRRFQAQMLNK